MNRESTLRHPAPLSGADYSAVELAESNDAVFLLDQRKLPEKEEYVILREAEQVADAIRDMVIRGAPAIGIAAAYAMVLAGVHGRKSLEENAGRLAAARPTAVNLVWAIHRMLRLAEGAADAELVRDLASAARTIHREDVAANRRMGEFGAQRIPDGATILTHCNAGALATGGFGTALGVIRAARAAGKVVRVIADETRPWLQGSRLTAWELARDGIPVSVIADSSAGSLFAQGKIDAAVVGADRIAANGDVANKIGTYTVACLARRHDRPLYVAAPWSTVDLSCSSGSDIPIEVRPAEEITHFRGLVVSPKGVGALNPSFDVTPAELVTAIFTERGIACPVGSEALGALGRQEGVSV